ncbi:hypothetical protein GF362_05790 [Candidatus Dojkabacteria bacterium]|nr:hypothetical protein [Candidatus Dojkabacteria bacterium]
MQEYLYLYKNIFLLFSLHLVFIIGYLLISIKNKTKPKVSSRNLDSIQTIKVLLKNQDNKVNINIEPDKTKTHLDIHSNTLIINSKIAQMPILQEILKTSIYILGSGSQWFKIQDLIKVWLEIIWYLTIGVTFLALIFREDEILRKINVILLLFITLFLFIDIFQRNKLRDMFFKKLKDNQIIDQNEIKTTTKILTKWVYKNLSFYFSPINDLISLLKRPKEV